MRLSGERVQMMLRETQIKITVCPTKVMSGSNYHYYHYTRPNRVNLFHKERLLKIMLRAASALPVWSVKKSVLERSVCHLPAIE